MRRLAQLCSAGARPYVRATKTPGRPAIIPINSWVPIRYTGTERITVGTMWTSGQPTGLIAPIHGDYRLRAIAGWSLSSGTSGAVLSATK